VVDRLLIDQRAEPSAPAARLVLFFHGFMLSPTSYRTLLRTMAGDDTVIVGQRMYRPGPAALAGRPTAVDEAAAGAQLLDGLRDEFEPAELWLAGHSRGGQVAWRAAGLRPVDGLVLVDPVDGSGPKEMRPTAAAVPAVFACATLIVGAGRAGRCAPEPVNHEVFAAAAPAGAVHVIVPDLGHADMLDGRARQAARRFCPGHDDPDAARETVGALVRGFLDGTLPEPGATPLAFEQR
jgi:pimeloyl-ACP methyl ester carboxylesterase